MNSAQLSFLASIAEKIPRLFQAIREGNMRAEYFLGTRVLDGRQVKLVLLAEVVDPGGNPLSTHSQPMPELANEDDGLSNLRVCRSLRSLRSQSKSLNTSPGNGHQPGSIIVLMPDSQMDEIMPPEVIARQAFIRCYRRLKPGLRVR